MKNESFFRDLFRRCEKEYKFKTQELKTIFHWETFSALKHYSKYQSILKQMPSK